MLSSHKMPIKKMYVHLPSMGRTTTLAAYTVAENQPIMSHVDFCTV